MLLENAQSASLRSALDALRPTIAALREARTNGHGRTPSASARWKIVAAQRLGGRRRGDRRWSLSMGGDGASSPQQRWPTFVLLRRPDGQSGESSKRRPEQVDYGLFPLWSGRVSGPARRSWHCLWTLRRNPLLRLWHLESYPALRALPRQLLPLLSVFYLNEHSKPGRVRQAQAARTTNRLKTATVRKMSAIRINEMVRRRVG
jgi:hypothetical protein